MGVVDGHVPAAADAQIGALWGDDVEFVAVVLGQTEQDVGSAVSGVVIHHNDVILE